MLVFAAAICFTARSVQLGCVVDGTKQTSTGAACAREERNRNGMR
jgi:hypothetical protein